MTTDKTVPSSYTAPKKFGTFSGVFTPTILTILGAIMYLREGWVVGNAGLIGAIAIIVIANIITFSTGLSIASVTTNIRVRAGGAFSIISQSLGLEVGGSVSVPLYLALSISVAFYIFAFGEGYRRIFPTHPEWLIVILVFGLALFLAYVSANLVIRVQCSGFLAFPCGYPRRIAYN
jgi:solute carrier family 12 (sodium/potassium/chloride transporter), member 2